jgi:hypothetical protein
VLLLSGMLGMLTCGGLLAAAVAWLRGPIVGVGLLLWVGLFAAFSWNFTDLGAFPPHAAGADAGRIVVGVALWLVTLIGLAPLVRMSSSRVFTGGAPRGGHLGALEPPPPAHV